MNESEIDWKADYLNLKAYTASLERDRANLWGVNEELRTKIVALEKGQQDLIDLAKAQGTDADVFVLKALLDKTDRALVRCISERDEARFNLKLAIEALAKISNKDPRKVNQLEAADIACEFNTIAFHALVALRM